jgi:hypothetical protein
MHGNGHKLSLNLKNEPPSPLVPPVEWDWDIEHSDRKLEAKADAALHGATPFQVDRRVLKDVVRENTGIDVGRITFLNSGELQSLCCRTCWF